MNVLLPSIFLQQQPCLVALAKREYLAHSHPWRPRTYNSMVSSQHLNHYNWIGSYMSTIFYFILWKDALAVPKSYYKNKGRHEILENIPAPVIASCLDQQKYRWFIIFVHFFKRKWIGYGILSTLIQGGLSGHTSSWIIGFYGFKELILKEFLYSWQIQLIAVLVFTMFSNAMRLCSKRTVLVITLRLGRLLIYLLYKCRKVNWGFFFYKASKAIGLSVPPLQNPPFFASSLLTAW